MCSTSDTCSAGSCSPGPPLDCDDGDVCTTDSCDVVLGCQHDPIPGCGIPVPSASPGGRVFLGLLVFTAVVLLLAQRRRSGGA